MKKIIVLILLVLLGVGIWYKTSTGKKPVDTTVTRYSNSESGISFTYPKILTASTTGGVAILHHDIPYENNGACDMTGDTQTYPRLTDFQVTMQVFNKDLVATMKMQSPYIPQENFINNQVVVSPGFIDAFEIGALKGYAIYEGAEGCGQTTYYFPLPNSRTLFITKASIQQLSTAISPEVRNKVLAVPGAISNEESNQIFNSILQSLQIQ